MAACCSALPWLFTHTQPPRRSPACSSSPLAPLLLLAWRGLPPQPARPRSRLLRLGRGFADPPNMPAAGQRHRLANFNYSDSTRLKLANSRSDPPRFKLPTKCFIGKNGSKCRPNVASAKMPQIADQMFYRQKWFKMQS